MRAARRKFYEPGPSLHEMQVLALIEQRPDLTHKEAAEHLDLTKEKRRSCPGA